MNYVEHITVLKWLASQIDILADHIEKLQNSPGEITPEDLEFVKAQQRTLRPPIPNTAVPAAPGKLKLR